jgi:hypothetical protein
VCATQIPFQHIKRSARVPDCPRGWFRGKTNGELLELAEANFDVFITLDKGFAYQQNLLGRRIAIILIRAKSTRLADLFPHAQACCEVIEIIRPGEIVQVGKGK